MAVAVLIFALAAAVTAGRVGPVSAQEGGGWVGAVPSTPGAHLAVWGGGSLSDGLALVPGAQSAWISQAGGLIGYVAGAPDFVNQTFLATFPGGEVEGGTPVLVVVGVPAEVSIASLALGADDFAPGAHVSDERCYSIGTRDAFVRLFDGFSGYLESGGVPMLLASSEIQVFASPEAALGHLNAVREASLDQVTEDILAGEPPFSAVPVGESPLQGTFYHDHRALGDGGAYYELTLLSGEQHGIAVAAVGRLLIVVSAFVDSEHGGVSVVHQAVLGLAERAVQRARLGATATVSVDSCP